MRASDNGSTRMDVPTDDWQQGAGIGRLGQGDGLHHGYAYGCCYVRCADVDQSVLEVLHKCSGGWRAVLVRSKLNE
jgi:hypothetical protein